MSLIRLNIKGISYSQTQSGAYALILSEENGERKLPIVIGAFEAQSIAIALEKDIRPPRPLTHDLFKNFSERFNIIVKQVIIHKLVDGVFYASLICENNNIEEIIDARTSDAIALALRFSAPIFTYKNILDKAGVILKIDNVNEGEKIEDSLVFESEPDKGKKMKVPADETFKDLSLSDLKDLLKKAVQGEDYEVAAKLRDEISKR